MNPRQYMRLLMECDAIMCHDEAVGILTIRTVVNGEVYTYDNVYCAQDLPWFKQQYEAKGHIVTEREL